MNSIIKSKNPFYKSRKPLICDNTVSIYLEDEGRNSSVIVVNAFWIAQCRNLGNHLVNLHGRGNLKVSYAL
jgi:hypothetical protein